MGPFNRSSRRRLVTLVLVLVILFLGLAAAHAHDTEEAPSPPVDPPLQPLQSMLATWPLDDSIVPSSFDPNSSPLCRFDYRDAQDRARALR